MIFSRQNAWISTHTPRWSRSRTRRLALCWTTVASTPFIRPAEIRTRWPGETLMQTVPPSLLPIRVSGPSAFQRAMPEAFFPDSILNHFHQRGFSASPISENTDSKRHDFRIFDDIRNYRRVFFETQLIRDIRQVA